MSLPVVLITVLTLQASPTFFAGTWRANLAKSQPHPSFQIESATLSFTIAVDAITIGSDVVFASGKPLKAGETFPTDGTERPGSHTPGVMVSARWVNARTLETLAKKDGHDLSRIIYEVSVDGKILTATSSGLVAQVIVFERN